MLTRLGLRGAEAFEQLRRRLALEFKLAEFLHESFARARTAAGLGERYAAAELAHRPGQRRRVSSFRRELPTQRSCARNWTAFTMTSFAA